jgi:hypothetical protein
LLGSAKLNHLNPELYLRHVLISLSAVAVAYAQSIAGTWQGTLPVGQSPRIVLKIADGGNGALRGSISFIDRSADVVPLLSTTYRAPNLTAAISDITFRGKLKRATTIRRYQPLRHDFADAEAALVGVWVAGNTAVVAAVTNKSVGVNTTIALEYT